MHAADIFSLGVVAFILLGGVKPLRGTRFMELHAEVRRGIKCEGARWADVSRDAKHLLEWMLHSSTTQRATVKDILEHPFIVKHADSFQAIENELAEEIQSYDKEEADEWSFVGAVSSEWAFVNDALPGEEPVRDSPRNNSGSSPPKDANGSSITASPTSKSLKIKMRNSVKYSLPEECVNSNSILRSLQADSASGYATLDRDPYFAEPVFNFLKYGKVDLTGFSDSEKATLRSEAEYFGVPGLIKLIDDAAKL